MKKTLFAFAFALSSFAAFADHPTAQQVCEKLSYNYRQSTKCGQIISRGNFSPISLTVAATVLNQNIGKALAVLEATVGQYVDEEAGKVCNQFVWNPSHALSCIQTIVGKRFVPGLPKLAVALVPNYNDRAVELLKAGADAYFQPSAIKLCDQLLPNFRYTMACVSAVMNKIYYNGAEIVCVQQHGHNPARAISCLASSGTTTTGFNGEGVLVDGFELKEIRKTLRHAKRLLTEGHLPQSGAALDAAIERLGALSKK